MESIDFSCFCSMLREPFHWTWRTPGGGKMGARRHLLPTAAYPVKPWVPALTLPVGSGQGPLPEQRQVLHPAASSWLPSLEITAVNLHEVFLGNAPCGDGPFSCTRQPRKCRLVVAAWPILPIAKIVDTEFWAALAPSWCGAHLGRELGSWFVVTHACPGGHPSRCSSGQQLSAWFLKLWITTPFWGGFSWGRKGFVLTRGQLSPLVWFVLFRCLPSSANGLAPERVHRHVVKTEVFLGCRLSSLGFLCNPCCGVVCSCFASHVADSSDFPQLPPRAKTGQQWPPGAQRPGMCCFGTSQTARPCTWGAWAGQPSWSHRVSWGGVGQTHILHAGGAERCSSPSVRQRLSPLSRGQVQRPDADCSAGGMVESFCRRQGLGASALPLCQQQALK